MNVVVPNMETWLASEANAKAAGRREPYSLDTVLREEVLESKLYVEDSISTNWHRFVLGNGPKPEAYAAYNLALIDLEETLCSK